MTQMTMPEALKWVADLFQEPLDNINSLTSREEIDAWDSLGTLSLLAGLDENFDIRLPIEQSSAFRTVGDILEVLRQHGQLMNQ